jgi:CheY-like chemotaxis protein
MQFTQHENEPSAPQQCTGQKSENDKFMRPKKIILCVDDNEQTLSVRTFLLETRGYRVLNAGTAQEALEILEGTAQGTLDLLIADLLMPGMDGNELVRRARQMHPMLPTLIVSGTVVAHDRALAADGFLPKGAGSAAELLERIKVLVARKRGPRKQISSQPLQPQLVPGGATIQKQQPMKHLIAS